MKYLILYLTIVLTFCSCSKEELFQNYARHNFWLFHKGAELPIVVEGNTNSKIFLLLLHGGPGDTAQAYNAFNQPFTDLLEDKYAMVYYDQRNAGLARGDWNEDFYTIEQHIEDLEKVIELLVFKFGSDIQVFLSGHSWGGYLGTAFLIKEDNQNKVVSWINIDGGINRNQWILDRFIRIPEIANEQISLNSFVDQWTEILNDINEEKNLGITQYNVESEINLNRIVRRSENLLFNSNIIETNVNSTFDGVYLNNYHPFIVEANSDRNISPLINQMYEQYDALIDENLKKLTLPALSIYGKYDVRTPKQQGDYLIENISTEMVDKKNVIIDNAGHSPMRTAPDILANEIIDWIEKYR